MSTPGDEIDPSGTIGPDGKKRKSGSQYKKDRDAKKKKEEEVLKKTKNIGTYFLPKPKTVTGM